MNTFPLKYRRGIKAQSNEIHGVQRLVLTRNIILRKPIGLQKQRVAVK
jgi:hypothetical protein